MRHPAVRGISQQWLKDLAKRWTRWRLSTGLEAQTCYRGVRALTRLSGFLAAAGIASAGGFSRDVLERYLADLAAAMAGKRDHRNHVGQVATLLRDVRRHQWNASLPASAVIFPEDYPRPGRRLPRALAGHVMAQVEDPASLARQDNPAYRLITLILIRCGLRITDATAIPSGCTVRDADGAPYLRYYNRKMKREALVPIDEELEALITRQRERNRERHPDGTPVLFPAAHGQHRRDPPDRLQHLPGRALPVAGRLRHPRRARRTCPPDSPSMASHAGHGPDQPRRPPARRAENTRPRFR